jgi:cyclic pyranopterin phosphate synthase
MGKLSHLDEKGRANMVDVSDKPVTHRVAVAAANVHMAPETRDLVLSGAAPKGDVLATARLAGIMAAKRTAELIPLCHPLEIDKVAVDFVAPENENRIEITATVSTDAKTGVEMEALTAASLAALTLYDMLKGVEKGIRITDLRLLKKTGGKSGDYNAL